MPEASQRTTDVPVTRKRKACPSRRVTTISSPITHVAEECEVRVAVRRIDRGARLAGVRRALELAGAEGERLPARAREHDRALAEPRHLDARDRPGVGP